MEASQNRLKQRLGAGELSVSMIVRISRGVEIGRLAAGAGFDALYLDLEHSALSLETVSAVCIAAQDAGVTPLVRIAGLSQIGRVLDGGAMGVIAPHVASAAEAREVVRAALFAPLGDRSFSSSLPQLGYRPAPMAAAVEAINLQTLVVVMIESAQGLDQVEAIAAVEGVDMLLVGAHDLSGDLGLTGRLDAPEVVEGIERVIASALKHGKAAGLGGLAGRPELLQRFVARGARFVSAGADVGFLQRAATESAAAVRALGPATP